MTKIGAEAPDTITAQEVAGWLNHAAKGLPAESCEELARFIERMRRVEPEAERERFDARDPPADRWWDLGAATEAAKLLASSMSKMIEHWEGLRWAPETRGGHEAMLVLATALEAALPYIEFPFGEYERHAQQQRARPKPWHVPAVAIAHRATKTMTSAGRSISDAALAGFVFKALGRLSHNPAGRLGSDFNFGTITVKAVNMYLRRRRKKYGA